MSAGVGALSAFGVGVENPATPLTPAAISVYYPIVSESLTANRAAVPSGSIVGDSMISAVAMGVSVCEGGFQMEVEGSVSGHAIWLWNGDNGYTHESLLPSANTGWSSAAPTLGAASVGGALPDGTYKWGVSTVYNRTNDSRKIIMPGSTISAGGTTSAGNNTILVTWVAPTAVPSGYTVAGYIIWRTIAGGSTLYFLKYQSGTGVTYSDAGAILDGALQQTKTPYSASIYEHIMVGSPPVADDRLTPFSAYANHNNDLTNRFVSCRMDGMKLAVSGLDDKLMADFTLKGAAADSLANFTPTVVPLEPMLGWHCIVQMNGVADSTLESFEINCSNGVQMVPGMRGVAFNRDTISGRRSIQGQLTRQFEDNDIWTQMLAGLDFSMRFTSYGQPIASAVNHGITSTMTNSGIDAHPFEFYIQIDLHRCKLSKAGGNTGGPDRIIEQIGFEAFKDATAGTDMTITFHNTTAQYQ